MTIQTGLLEHLKHLRKSKWRISGHGQVNVSKVTRTLEESQATSRALASLVNRSQRWIVQTTTIRMIKLVEYLGAGNGLY